MDSEALGDYERARRNGAALRELYGEDMSRVPAALFAGVIAIALNTIALAAADLVPLATAHGGLLRLLVMMSRGTLHVPAGSGFQMAFHIVVGLAMAVFYALLVEPLLRGPSWWRGTIYGALAWIANAIVVLPATGEGFAGSRHLTLAGMIWFATAHMLFFVLQAVLYARLCTLASDAAGRNQLRADL